jgi:6-phosphogluconate dehydrogenase
LENTLYTGMLFAYAQWYALIMRTSKEESWDINLSEVSRIWQGWCIIRAKILDFLTNTFLKNQNFEHLFELDEIQKEIINSLDDYKKFINTNLDNNISTPSLSAWINYFYSITSAKSSANLIQWLRDYFWAHTYERTDREWIFHTNW